MFLQKPLEMQSGEASLQYVLEGCGIISLKPSVKQLDFLMLCH